MGVREREREKGMEPAYSCLLVGTIYNILNVCIVHLLTSGAVKL